MPKQFALPLSDEDEAGPPLETSSLSSPSSNDVEEKPAPHPHDEGLPMPDENGSSSQRTAPLSPFRDFDISLLALSHVRGVGLKTLRALYEHFDDLSAVWSTPLDELVATLQQLKIKDSAAIAATIVSEQEALRADAQRDLYRLRGESIQILARHDPAFPARLAASPDAPHWLFIEGEVAALHSSLIGIVGTRTPSPIGVQAAERLTALICREGFGIVSGLAEGIDAAAHRVALYYRAPQVAVLGTGIDIVFPASTVGIRRRIIETGGAVITEYLPGDNYSRANFVQRNRIQAALALALTPVESQEKSGTAHTVRFAVQYGRPLFGVVRGDPAPQNDMVALLTAGEWPVFDLEQRERIGELITWLRTVIPDGQWPVSRRQVDGRSFFDDVLRLIDDVLADVPMAPQDIAWLQEQLALRLPGSTQQPQPTEQRRGRR